MDASKSTTGTANMPSLNLRLDVEEVKGELALQDPASITADKSADAELEKKAQDYAESLINLSPDDIQQRGVMKTAVEGLGRDLQRKSAQRSRMLQQPIKELSRYGADGGPVANALVELKMQVESLDPNRLDFSPGWGTRLLGMIPGVGSTLKRYFSRYESAQTIIDTIINSLEKGGEQLTRDNITLVEDQKVMRELTFKLERQVKLAILLDQKLMVKLEREIPQDDPRHKFVEEELIFPLRQRTMDLQQQLAVNQQGILSIEIIIRNNLELIRGVNRAIDVTVSALQVAVTVALALAHQRIVLNKIKMLNKTTSDLIAGTAATLRTQGTAIQTQAAESGLEMEALKSAFADIHAAMDEISNFRREALPRMAQTILDFDQLTASGEAAIQKMEQGQQAQAQPVFQLDAE